MNEDFKMYDPNETISQSNWDLINKIISEEVEIANEELQKTGFLFVNQLQERIKKRLMSGV